MFHCPWQITPTQFHQTMNDINEILISAHSIRHSFLDNFIAVVTLQLSTLVMASHYTKVSDRVWRVGRHLRLDVSLQEMRRLKRKIEELNTQMYNPVGLHILWPQKVAFLFVSERFVR